MPRPGWRDVALFFAFFGLLYGTLHLIHWMRAPFVSSHPLSLDLSPAALPGVSEKTIPLDHPMIQTARLIGLCLGD